jgi:hypothetical protein
MGYCGHFISIAAFTSGSLTAVVSARLISHPATCQAAQLFRSAGYIRPILLSTFLSHFVLNQFRPVFIRPVVQCLLRDAFIA